MSLHVLRIIQVYLIMKVSGLWTPIRNEDNTIDTTPWDFHIETKNQIRDMFSKDPDAKGSSLILLKNLIFNEKLAIREDNELYVVNEQFVNAMLDDLELNFKLYKIPYIEKLSYGKMRPFTIALLRNDSAYYERMMGILGLIIQNHDKFNDLNKDYINELNYIYNWWKSNDNRDRTKPWIDWVFRFIINKYQSSNFYKRSINHMLYWCHLNHDKWQFHESHYPQNWFCNGRGAQVNALYGGNF